MTIAKYFKFDFKKPELSASDKANLEKIQSLKTKIDSLSSRIESLEILNSNAKFEDFGVLAKLLSLDFKNVLLELYNLKSISNFQSIEEWILSIPSIKLQKSLQKSIQILQLDTALEWKEDFVNEVESGFLEVFDALNSEFSRECNSGIFHSEIGEFYKRIKIQLAVVSLAVVSISGYLIYQKINYPSSVDTTVEIYYTTPENINYSEEMKITSSFLADGNWKEVVFPFPKATNLSRFRLDTGTRKDLRVQIAKVLFLAENATIVQEFNFEKSEKNFFKDFSLIESLIQLEPSNVGKSEYLELTTKGIDPYINFLPRDIKNVNSVNVKIRIVPQHKKF